MPNPVAATTGRSPTTPIDRANPHRPQAVRTQERAPGPQPPASAPTARDRQAGWAPQHRPLALDGREWPFESRVLRLYHLGFRILRDAALVRR
jgi:hypothetical protein